MSEDHISTDVETAVHTNQRLHASDDILQHRLDAIEVLQITLEDVKSHQSKNDVSTVLERVEMCCRFLESAPWSDENGIIENIGLKLIEIHMNLFNGKPIGTDFLGAKEWEDMGTILTSTDSQESTMQPSSKLLKRDYRILKLMIIDRVVELLISGPLEFSNSSTLKLLERIELCRRYLEDDDLDLPALKIVSDDILRLVNLIDCYEVMEFWETIDFKNWVIRSMKTALHGFSRKIKARKVYSSADIEEEKLALVKQCRTILASKPSDYCPPVMMKCYPIHPYLTNHEKLKNRSVLQQNGKIRMRLFSGSKKSARAKQRDDVLDRIDSLRIDESNANMSKTLVDHGDIDCTAIVVLHPSTTNEVKDSTIPTFTQLNSKSTYQPDDCSGVYRGQEDTSDSVVSILPSEIKPVTARNETSEQDKDLRISMEATSTTLVCSASPLPSSHSHFPPTNSVVNSPSIFPFLSSESLLPPPPPLLEPGPTPPPTSPYPSPTALLPAPIPYPSPVSFSSTHILGSSWPLASNSLVFTPSAPSYGAPVYPPRAPFSLSVPHSLPSGSAYPRPMSTPTHAVPASPLALTPPVHVYDYSSHYRQYPHC